MRALFTSIGAAGAQGASGRVENTAISDGSGQGGGARGGTVMGTTRSRNEYDNPGFRRSTYETNYNPFNQWVASTLPDSSMKRGSTTALIRKTCWKYLNCLGKLLSLSSLLQRTEVLYQLRAPGGTSLFAKNSQCSTITLCCRILQSHLTHPCQGTVLVNVVMNLESSE